MNGSKSRSYLYGYIADNLITDTEHINKLFQAFPRSSSKQGQIGGNTKKLIKAPESDEINDDDDDDDIKIYHNTKKLCVRIKYHKRKLIQKYFGSKSKILDRKSKTNLKSESKSQTKSQTKSASKSQTKSASKSQTNSTSKTESKSKSHSKSHSKSKSTSKSQNKSKSKAKHKSKSKSTKSKKN